MANQLDITAAQRDASDRHDLEEAIYLLRGTLVGRGIVPQAQIRWATRRVTFGGQEYKAYLGPPLRVSRTMGFEPGSQGSYPEIKLPVRNLPFAHSESLVAAITDEDFRVENTVVDLRVAYLQPGQTPDDLVDADFTPLILNGFLGPADEVTLDGFLLPVYNRGARRNQNLFWPRMPSRDTISGGAMDSKDGGTMPPFCVGVPQDWVRVPALNLGVRGFTTSGIVAGTTQITFRTITEGPENLASGDTPADPNLSVTVGGDFYGSGLGQASLMVHYLFPVYQVASASFDETLREFTVTLTSGLAADVPRGAFVQQYGAAFNPNNGVTAVRTNGDFTSGRFFSWVFGNDFQSTVDDLNMRYGWRFADGEVRPADPSVWQLLFKVGLSNISLRLNGGQNFGRLSDPDTEVAVISLSRGGRTTDGGSSTPVAPVYYDPLADPTVEVNTQPEFTSTVTSLGAINRPTGGTGTDNDKMRDGSDATGGIVNTGNTVTLTFNSAPSPFDDGDTTKSVLHVIASTTTGDGVRLTNLAGSTEFGAISSLGGQTQFSFPQVSARSFDTTVRIVNENGGSAQIHEVWWEHDLSAEVQSTRTQDVTLVSSASPLGPVMQFAELVVQPTQRGSRIHAMQVSGGNVQFNPATAFHTTETIPGLTPSTINSYYVPYPTNVMLGLHMLLGDVEGDYGDSSVPPRAAINEASYFAAHQKFVSDNIRLGFVWDDSNKPRSWTELERMVGEQTRSFMFYGPSGHEILYLSDAEDFEAETVQRSFRLPSVPGANTLGGGQPLFERTRTTELVNSVEARWDRSFLTGEMRRNVSGSNSESIDDIGVRARDKGPYIFDLHSPWEGNSAYTSAAVVSGLCQFYADRHAFAATRFNFDTAWPAHGLDRGSIIRVTYPVSTSPASFRNVVCEVESIEVSPLNGERFNLRARSIGKPQKGIEAAFTWVDVFTQESDQWTDKILQEFDQWGDYWSTP